MFSTIFIHLKCFIIKNKVKHFLIANFIMLFLTLKQFTADSQSKNLTSGLERLNNLSKLKAGRDFQP